VSQDQDRRQTKAERKEQARRERIELERRIATRKRGRRRALIAGVVVIAIVAGTIVAFSQGNGTNAADGSASPSVTVQLPDPAKLPGILRTAPPWPDNIAEANARMAKMSELSPCPRSAPCCTTTRTS
jgi:hypothetical protein